MTHHPVYMSITAVATCGCSRPLAERTCEHGVNYTDPRRKTALAGSLRSIGTCVAAVLTNALKILSLLLPRKAWTHLSQLRCERRAMAPWARREADLLDAIYGATLDRLGNKRNESAWWREVVLTAEGDYVLPYGKSDADDAGPHLLRIESVREWLSNYHVRADLKALATERILADGTDTAFIRARLAQSYADHTSDDPILARVPIDTVVCGLVAGALSSLGTSERIVVSLMRENNLRLNQANADILAAIFRIESFMASNPGRAAL